MVGFTRFLGKRQVWESSWERWMLRNLQPRLRSVAEHTCVTYRMWWLEDQESQSLGLPWLQEILLKRGGGRGGGFAVVVMMVVVVKGREGQMEGNPQLQTGPSNLAEDSNDMRAHIMS